MSAPTAGRELPGALAEILDELNAPTLHTVHTYVEQRLDELQSSLQEQIRSEATGEVVDIEDRGTYTLVRKHPPSQGDHDNASRPLFLYRVKRERRLNGEESLHWSYLGTVTGQNGIECGTCGTRLNTHETACPHCGEDVAHGDEEG